MDAPLPRTDDLQPPPPHSGSSLYRHDYEFTEDWFTINVDVWAEALAPYTGKPDVRYLEIGLFEGRSALWMAGNVLTHETSRITGIDPFFDQETEDRFYANLSSLGEQQKFTIFKGLSQRELPKLERESFDIVYIDGSHTADDVLADAVMSWEVLKEGGLVIFDDYSWLRHLPSELRPMVAIDAFVTAYRERLEVVHRGYQVLIKKKPPKGCTSKQYCSAVGDSYAFYWQTGELLEVATGKPVEMDAEERAMLEQLLRSRRFGADASTFLPEDVAGLRANPGFESFLERLGIEL